MVRSLYRHSLLWCACLVHTWQGVAIFTEPSARYITALALFAWLPPWLYGGVILLTVFLAILGLRWSYLSPSMRVKYLIPQQILMILSSLSGLNAVYLGRYGDSAIYPRGFIGPDQAMTICVAFFHFLALLYFSTAVRRRYE